jgi:hypothetical protein
MPRENYTNVGPSQERDALLEKICNHLALDPSEHSGRLGAIDFALRKAAQSVEQPEPSAEILRYLSGHIRAGEIEDDQARKWACLRELDQARKQREHDLKMLGYNQAMLDWADFPVQHNPDDIRTREEQAQIVERLKEKLYG